MEKQSALRQGSVPSDAVRVVPASVPAMLQWRVTHDPDAVFIITPDGRERTYRDLVSTSRLLARRLADAGVRRGDVVGLHLANDPGWVVALFACWWVGAAAACCGALVPVAEAVRRFRLAKALHVIADGNENETFPWPTTWISKEGEARDGRTAMAAESSLLPADAIDPEAVAAILFTSGTTGEPKAISRLHHHLAEAPRMTAGAYAKSADFRPRAAPPHLPPAVGFHPFGHSAPLGRMVFRMYVGRALIILPKFDVEEIALIARRYPLDSLQLTPAMIHSLAYAETDLHFKALKYVTSGTAPLPVATRETFETRFGVPVLQAYGSTESAITALERYEDVMAGRRGRGSVGRIPDGMPHRIIHRDGGDVAAGEEGELLGRLKEVPGAPRHPAVDDEGWFHTGDLARIDEHGILYITGRLKDMMIVGGFNVYPGEVEDVLIRAGEIAEVVVVAMPDERLGEIPVAGIVWDKSVAAGERQAAWERIATEARRSLEPYKIPRRWFPLDELPRNLTGKVDRMRAAAAAAMAGEAQGAAVSRR